MKPIKKLAYKTDTEKFRAWSGRVDDALQVVGSNLRLSDLPPDTVRQLYEQGAGAGYAARRLLMYRQMTQKAETEPA